MTTQSCWYLKNYDLFKGISPSIIKKIAKDAVMKECKKSCTIYEPTNSSNYVYLIKRGEVELYYNKNGKRFVFDTLGPGSVFGNLEMKRKTFGHYAEGGPGVCVCMIPIAQFLEVLSAHPEVMVRYLQDMSAKIAEYQALFDAHHSSAEELVLHELERLQAKRHQQILGKLIKRPLRITHEHLAELTGLNRVTVTRTMKKLRESGQLSVDPKTGIITLRSY